MKDFKYWKNKFESNDLQEFSLEKSALLWLKIKSILRKDILSDFITINSIQLVSKTLQNQFVELFEILSKNIEKSNSILDSFIRQKNQEQKSELDFELLVSELYKLKQFDWGGDYNNSLDKYLVSKYVKNCKSFDLLQTKFDTEISTAVRGYVLNSWYNHWSSIVIEHVFKSHSAVLPTVGQVKSVDFIINNIPFDLKVTYMPNEYLKQKRKENGLLSELSFLKQNAQKANINYDKKAKEADVIYEITEKMKDKSDEFCAEVLNTLRNQKLEIINHAKSCPKLLATWLYENQGEMRFGAENRLFIVLVDLDDINNSWKLKRNIELLNPSINSYLDNFHSKSLDELLIKFSYKGREHSYVCYSDIIFIAK